MAKKKNYKDGYQRVVVKIHEMISNTLKTKGQNDLRMIALEQYMFGSLKDRFVLDGLEYTDKITHTGHASTPLYDINRIVGYIEEIDSDLSAAIIIVAKSKEHLISEDYFDNKVLSFIILNNFHLQKGSVMIGNAFIGTGDER